MVQMIFSESVIFEGDHGRRGHLRHQSAMVNSRQKHQFQDV